MSNENEISLYDQRFSRWLSKREQAIQPLPARDRKMRRAHKVKIDLNGLIRAQFDSRALARLNALGYAT